MLFAFASFDLVMVVTWTVINLAGVVLMGHLLRESLLDRHALSVIRQINGRRVIANRNVNSAAFRLTVMALFAAIGLVALVRDFTTPGNPDAWTNIIRLGLVAGVSLLAWDAWQDRRLVQALWPREERQGGQED